MPKKKPPRKQNEPTEMLVLAGNPEDFVNWSSKRQIDYYQRTVEWHRYVRDLVKQGKIIHAWGTQRLISNTRLSPNKSLVVAIYRTASVDEFSKLIVADPLYDRAVYYTQPLESLAFDYKQDLERFERHRQYLANKLGATAAMQVVERRPVLEYPFPTPWIKKKSKREGKIRILVISTNSQAFIDYTDEQKLNLYEKVMQWHDYNDRLMKANIVREVWTSHQFCDLARSEGRVATANQIFYVDSAEEFDTIFAADPVRSVTRFWTLWLTSLEESEVRSADVLGRARARI